MLRSTVPFVKTIMSRQDWGIANERDFDIFSSNFILQLFIPVNFGVHQHIMETPPYESYPRFAPYI